MPVRPGKRIGGWGLTALWAWAFFFALASGGALAEEERASFTVSPNGAIRLYAGGDLVALGGVRLVQGETEIRADRARYRADDETAEFIGDVRVVRDGHEITGSAFSYDVAAQEGRLSDASAKLDLEESDDFLYVTGDAIDFGESQATVHQARFTTCRLPDPGYYLESRRMDIFPGERVVIRNVRFVESGVPLFYWPYVVISLREDRPSRLHFPELGRNAEDGWYAKFRYAYDGPGEGYGEAALDILQHKGVGVGVKHTYRDQPGSTGSVTAYRLSDKSTGHNDLRLGLDERFSLTKTTRGSLRAAYLTEGADGGQELRETRLGLALDRTAGPHTSRFEWSGLGRAGAETLRSGQMRLDHTSRFDDWEWRLQSRGLSFDEGGERSDTRLGYLNSVRYTGPAYTLQLDIERRIHPSLFNPETTSTPSWKRISRMPEGTLALDLEALISPYLPVDFELGYGRFEEVRRGSGEEAVARADRTSAAFRLKPGSLSLGSLGRFNYRAGAEWQAYDPGEKRLILSADYRLRTSLTRAWSITGSYSYQEVLGGASPFQFDAESDHERVNGRLQYQSQTVSFILSSGYDFIDREASDIVAQVTLHPTEDFRVSVQGGYDPVTDDPTYLSASVSLTPLEGWSAAAAVRYSFLRQAYDQVTGRLSIAYPGWRFDYDAVYNGVKDRFDRGDISLIRDLGCREVGLRYSRTLGEIWLEYRIPALPGADLRVGANRDQFLFEPEGFFDLF